ncbi:MAG: transglutaminase-like domain-containing protein [Ginsengibacter sp.]
MNRSILTLIFTGASLIVAAQKETAASTDNAVKKLSQVSKQVWPASELWSQSISQNLKLVNGAIILDDNLLIEDDSPGMGSTRAGLWDTIGYGVTLRKYLTISRWPVKKATITMMAYPVQPSEAMSGGKLEFKVNGHAPIVYEVRHSWTSVPVPKEYLKYGENVIEVTVHGRDTKFSTPIALYSNYKYGVALPPSSPHSKRSLDGGRTWTHNDLGGSGNNSGEYPIRLKLEAYHQTGWLQTPVINLAETAIKGVLYFPSRVTSTQIKLDSICSGGSKLILYIRSGNTHLPEVDKWTDWRILSNGMLPSDLHDRFIQLKLSFKSNSGIATPQMLSLSLHSQWTNPLPGVSKEIAVTGGINYAMIRSSFPFQNEIPTYPALRELRKKYHLDKIVEGAHSEWEKIKLLQDWVAGLWEWYMPDPELPDMVTWDAQDVLSTTDRKGKPKKIGGFCLYYNIVFVQACQSLGIAARIVNINYSVLGGHEVSEVWSRDFGKWVMIDGQFDNIYYDRKTKVPLSVLELHTVFLDTYYPGKEVIDRDAWNIQDRDRRSENIDPSKLPIYMESGGHALSNHIGKDYVWWKVVLNKDAPGYSGGYGFFNTAEVRWLPRSNWLSQPLPMPIAHGVLHWPWDGYLEWTDAMTPESPEHRYFVRRESDMYGRLFTVDFSAQAAEKGFVHISMATDSPGFAYFELSNNGRPVTTPKHEYLWKLTPGLNNLELRSVDVFGNRGAMSNLSIKYTPNKPNTGKNTIIK